MKINWKMLILCIAVPLIVGGVSGVISMSGMDEFASINKPPLSPPAWLFPVVWSMLYILMGISLYIVLNSKPTKNMGNGVLLFAVQLIFNFFWSIWFFNLQAYFFSFVWILALLALIIATTFKFTKVNKKAGYLMIPYIIWVSFAAYLNLAIAILN